jgi:hypothetical protein
MAMGVAVYVLRRLVVVYGIAAGAFAVDGQWVNAGLCVAFFGACWLGQRLLARLLIRSTNGGHDAPGSG